MHPYIERLLAAHEAGLILLPNWLDFSGFKPYLDCPRYMMFANILGMVPASMAYNIDLIFGKAIHEGLEAGYQVWKDLAAEGDLSIVESEAVDILATASIEKFTEKFDELDGPALEEPPKTYQKGCNTLRYYWEENAHSLLHHTEVVAVERPFALPIREGYPVLYGTIDLLVRNFQGLGILEHKTTKSFGARFESGWDTSWQVECYSTAAYLIYGEIPWTLVNGLLFQKSKGPDLKPILVRKTEEQLSRFHHELIYRIKDFHTDVLRLLDNVREGAPVSGFPRNPNACQGYRLCRYYDFCTNWLRPYERSTPPAGWMWAPIGENDLFVEHKKT